MTKEQAGEWLMHNRYFAEQWCKRVKIDPNDLSTFDVEIMKGEYEASLYRCKHCNEIKPKHEFNSFDNTRVSLRCKPCQKRIDHKLVVFEDGLLKTKQVKGFNWLLGYSVIEKRYE